MKILDISKNLENIVSLNDLSDLANPLKNEFAISKSKDLEKVISDMETEGRVLRVGIVGRVKAGKSSLLNALIFDGKNILPKAATPMTAALTKLEYGERTEASVDFYTQEDINDLKIDFDRYNQKLLDIKQQQIEELSKIRLNKLKIKELDEKSKNEIEQQAEEIANMELLEDDKLSASYDQYTRIKQSGITLVDLENYKNIEAEDIESLNKKLYDFVGADGKYMPFTKTVTIRLNDEKLKNIEIIDTPGINDPIASREKITKELLKYCDVILIVSPAEKFLSNTDIELLDRISIREGIQEIYIIASKFDTEITGEKEKNQAVLPKVIESLKQTLTNQMRNILTKQKSLYPLQSKLFDKLMQNDVIYSSGVSYSLLRNFHNREYWDENLHHQWKRFNEDYKDYFSDDESAKANLKNLANIDKVNEILSEIRSRKNEILISKKENFEKTKLESIYKYKESLQNSIKEDIKRIETGDINVIKTQKINLEKIKIEASESLNETYADIIDSFEENISELLFGKVKSFFNQSNKDVDGLEESDTKIWTTKEGGIFGFFQDTVHHSETYMTVKAHLVRTILEKLTYDLEDSINNESKKSIKDLKSVFYQKLISILREKVGDENIDVYLVQRTIKSILNSIIYPEIIYTGILPNELKRSGILKEKEAEQFMEEAKSYISNFQQRVRKDIKEYLLSTINLLKNQNIGEDIFSSYSKDIEKLECEINNKKLNLDIKLNILKQLEMVI